MRFFTPPQAWGPYRIANVIEGVDIIVGEIGANNAHSTSATVYEQIRELSWTMESIKGETSLTITTAKDGKHHLQRGRPQRGDVRLDRLRLRHRQRHGVLDRRACFRTFAIAETAAAAVGHLADAVAVAYGDNVSATTTVG